MKFVAMIVTGTSAQGAVAGTTNGAAQRGYKAVLPVDEASIIRHDPFERGDPAVSLHRVVRTVAKVLHIRAVECCPPLVSSPRSCHSGIAPGIDLSRR
jgi:hypothetical protein